MINAVMHQLTYDNPPIYARYSSYRNYLRSASKYSCAYCTITESESPGATFNIEHFRPDTLFHKLASTCTNLRYSCPRCNSYKRDLWISVEEGCIRDCDNCTTKSCKKNIDRFIDVLTEDPSSMLYLGDDNKLYAFSGSRPANYTIKYLRLNRDQLIKLRHVRKFMDSWRHDLIEQKKEADTKLEKVKSEQEAFLSQKHTPSTRKEELLFDAMKTMYEMLVLLASQLVYQTDEELGRINKLIEYRVGSDSLIEGQTER